MSRRKYLRVILDSEQTRQLNLPTDLECVRAAFYLGLPYMVIQNRVRHEAYRKEREDTIETAVLLGMSDRDIVVYKEG